MKYLHKSAIALATLACAASFVLAGCGGGGGDSDTQQPAIRFAAEGFWGGPDVNATPPSPGPISPPWNGATGHFWGTPSMPGNYLGMVVLSTGETWGIYTADDVVVGALHGWTQTTGTNVTINKAHFFDISQPGQSSPANTVTFSGAVSPRYQLDITDITDNPGPHFLAVYDTSYDQAASLSTLANTYTGTGGTTRSTNPGTHYSISIDGNGAITLPPDAEGCSASGTATPHTDKNLFDISLQFSGTNCALGNGAVVNGIAVLANDGHLWMMGATKNDTDEFIYVSQ